MKQNYDIIKLTQENLELLVENQNLYDEEERKKITEMIINMKQKKESSQMWLFKIRRKISKLIDILNTISKKREQGSPQEIWSAKAFFESNIAWNLKKMLGLLNETEDYRYIPPLLKAFTEMIDEFQNNQPKIRQINK